MNPHTTCRNWLPLAITSTLALTGTAQADLIDALYVTAPADPAYVPSQIEIETALATQAIYDQLAPSCAASPGNNNNLSNARARANAVAVVPCTGDVLKVWTFVNEVVINGQDLQNGVFTAGRGTPGTLGRTSPRLLGRALQWCNGEEFTGLGAQASSFTGGQIANLANRISGLRFSSAGPVRIAGNQLSQFSRGGGASADALTSAWSGYMNGDYTKGSHDITSSEAQYDFRGRNFTTGLDKRFTRHWVAGAMLGYQSQNLDFVNVLTGGASVINAHSKSHGTSLMPYALLQADRWYANLSFGYQRMSFDTRRDVNYGSGPAIPSGSISHKTLNTSSVDSRSWSSYNTVGYAWRPAAKLSVEPSLSLDWRHITIGSFVETDSSDAAFNFAVDEQRINSLEAIPALRLQYSFTPRRGVFTPYLDVQWHRQLHDQARDIHAVYAAVADVVADSAKFSIRTDPQDASFQVYSAGFSAVLSGAQHGGLQVYANYRWYRQLSNYSLHSVSGGLRYEF